MLKHAYIYILICPESGAVRYVGKTKDANARLKNHINKSYKPKSHKECWIKGLIVKGLKPKLEIVDKSNIEDIDFWERHYISLYRSWGFDLTNATDGGDGAINLSLDARKKISNSLTGKKQSEDTRAKIRESVRRAWGSEKLRSEQSARVVARNAAGFVNPRTGITSEKKGKTFEEQFGESKAKEVRRKMSDASIGRYNVDISEEELIDLYLNQKMNVADIARIFKTKRDSIYLRLGRLGIDLRSKIIPKETLIDLYINQGLARSTISEMYGCSRQKIEKDLRKHGIKKYEQPKSY